MQENGLFSGFSVYNASKREQQSTVQTDRQTSRLTHTDTQTRRSNLRSASAVGGAGSPGHRLRVRVGHARRLRARLRRRGLGNGGALRVRGNVARLVLQPCSGTHQLAAVNHRGARTRHSTVRVCCPVPHVTYRTPRNMRHSPGQRGAAEVDANPSPSTQTILRCTTSTWCLRPWPCTAGSGTSTADWSSTSRQRPCSADQPAQKPGSACLPRDCLMEAHARTHRVDGLTRAGVRPAGHRVARLLPRRKPTRVSARPRQCQRAQQLTPPAVHFCLQALLGSAPQ
jgi:hypothetical protein